MGIPAAAIDFGTTNTTMALVNQHDEIHVLDPEPGSKVLPSIVYLDRHGLRQAGTDATRSFLVIGASKTNCRGCDRVQWDLDDWYSKCTWFRPSGGCHDARLMAGLKGVVAGASLKATHSWGYDFSVTELLAVVFKRLRAKASETAGTEVDSVVIGHPVVFEGAEGPNHEQLQRLGLERLIEAASESGFRRIEPFPEPAAASLSHSLDEGTALMVDFGGGTFDVAVAQVGAQHIQVRALEGAPIGGQLLDAELFTLLAGDQLGLNAQVGGRPVPASLREQMRTLARAQGLINDPRAVKTLYELKSEAGGEVISPAIELLFGGHAHAFYSEIERAKIALSTQDTAEFRFSRRGLLVASSVDRRVFEQAIGGHIEHVMRVTLLAVERAGLQPAEVTSVLYTGGSSQVPLFRKSMADAFPRASSIEADPFSAVVVGLAEYAREVFA